MASRRPIWVNGRWLGLGQEMALLYALEHLRQDLVTQAHLEGAPELARVYLRRIEELTRILADRPATFELNEGWDSPSEEG